MSFNKLNEAFGETAVIINNKEIDTMENNMMIKTFESEEFGAIRTVDYNGETWFVAKDICDDLGYGNSRDAIRKHVWDKNKIVLTSQNATLENMPNRGLSVVNESGVYQLIFASKMPKAQEFQAWVFDVVLPSIRQTGGYMTTDVATEIANGNIEALNNILTASLQLNLKLKQENAALAEKVDEYDELIGGRGCYYIKTLGKQTVGANKIFKQLMIDKIIYKDYAGYCPYSEYDEYFVYKLSKIQYPSGEERITQTLMLTPEGYYKFLKKYKTYNSIAE